VTLNFYIKKLFVIAHLYWKELPKGYCYWTGEKIKFLEAKVE